MRCTSQVRFFNSVIKHFVPSLWTRFIFLGLLLKSLPLMKSIEVKHVPQFCILMVILFRWCNFLSQCQPVFICYHFQHISRILFLLDLSFLPNIFKWVFLHDNHQKILNMDVVILDTYLTLNNKIGDTDTHHIHNKS